MVFLLDVPFYQMNHSHCLLQIPLLPIFLPLRRLLLLLAQVLAV